MRVAFTRFVSRAGRTGRRGAGLAVLVLVALAAATGAPAEPELKVIREAGWAHPGQPYRIVCEVSWEGDSDRYRIGPATVEAIDWGVVTVDAMESTVRAGINVVAQTVTIKPEKPGQYETPEILISYRNPEDLTPPETVAPATNPTDPGVDPTLAVSPFILLAKPDRTPRWFFGGLGALLLCLTLGWWFARTRRSPALRPSLATHPVSGDPLEDARRSRLDGEYYDFYRSLIRTLEVCPEQGVLLTRLKARAQDVGYRGIRPTDDEMTADFEDVRRVLDAHMRKPENPV